MESETTFDELAIMESNTTFDDVKGLTEAKAELDVFVQYLKYWKCITPLGARFPTRVLLIGPPGTGKTMLARAVAGEAQVPLVSSSGAMGAAGIRSMFAVAKEKSPCLVFIDKLDAYKASSNCLLAELDAVKQSEGIVVLGATNFPELVDKALVSSGRFDHHVAVPLPDIAARRQILEFHLSKVPKAGGVDLMPIARDTLGFSGADLIQLVKLFEQRIAKGGSKAVNSWLTNARSDALRGTEAKPIIMTERSRKLVSFHEAGRVIVATYSNEEIPIQKATIVPQKMSSDFIDKMLDRYDICISRKQLLARLDVFMGGHATLELVNRKGKVSYGPYGLEYDMRTAARRLATKMVTMYGMSKEIGLFYYEDENNLNQYMKSVADIEVKKLTDNASQNAKAIVESHMEELHALANAILEEETLTRSQIKDLLDDIKQKSSTRTAKDSTKENAETLVPERKLFEDNEEGDVSDLKTLARMRKSRITIKEPGKKNDFAILKNDKWRKHK